MGVDTVCVQIEPNAVTSAMDPSKIFVYFGYAMSGLFMLMGGYLLFFFPPEFKLSEKFRVMFGVVLLLYGIYRAVSLRLKQRQQEDEER